MRAWAKISAMAQPVSTIVQPVVGTWQSLSFTLPGVLLTSDPRGVRKSADIFFMIAPLDVPARYTLRSVTVEPVTRSISDRLRAWWVERVG